MIKKVFTILALNILLPFSGFSQSDTSIIQIIPTSENLSGWRISNQKIYLGDDLFYLINGGAELYFEYGFEEVAALNCEKDENASLYIEIYEMKDALAAFGIYSLFSSNYNTSGKGIQLSIDGQHLFFCKGRYFVMIRNKQDSDDADLQKISNMISHAIPQQDKLPSWLGEKISTRGEFSNFYLIKGIIGLNNHYYFGQEDVFEFDAGLVIKYPDKQKFYLHYSSEDLAIQAAERFRNFMESSAKFEDKQDTENVFFDKKGQRMQFYQEGNFLELSINKSTD